MKHLREAIDKIAATREEMIDFITEGHDDTRPRFERMNDKELKKWYEHCKSMERERELKEDRDLPKIRSIVRSEDGVYSIVAFDDGVRLYTGEEDRCVLVRPRDIDKEVYTGNKYVDAVDEWEHDYPIKERTMTRVEEIHFLMVYEGISRQDAEAMMEE